MSRELIRLTSSFANKPLLITPTELASICDYLLEGRRETVINLGADIRQTPINAVDQSYKITAANGVAHLQIIGSLSHRSMGLESLCGAGMSSYNTIRSELDLALSDDSVKVILLELDTNGGEAAGCFDLAAYIKKASSVKPIIGYASEKALSAGYAIISACSEVILPPSGELGSIGVVAIHQDISKRLTKEGIKITPLYCGEDKILGNSFEPLSAEAKAKIMGKLSLAYDSFVSLVAENRGISEETVRDTQAGVFTATEAVELGLADKVMSFSELEDYVIGMAAESSTSATPRYGQIITQASLVDAENNSVEESTMSDTLTQAERDELAQLRAEKAANVKSGLITKAESFAGFGIDPQAYAEQVTTLGAEHPFVAMMDAALQDASTKLDAATAEAVTLKAENEQLKQSQAELAADLEENKAKADAADAKVEDTKEAAKAAVVESAAMSELGVTASGDQTTVVATGLDGLKESLQAMFNTNK